MKLIGKAVYPKTSPQSRETYGHKKQRKAGQRHKTSEPLVFSLVHQQGWTLREEDGGNLGAGTPCP